ncbi:MAG: permease [Euryarchaeota archaeon]|nr:permease [Euryarchaeota archaeon]
MRFGSTIWIYLICAVLLFIIAYTRVGQKEAVSGVRSSLVLFLEILPLIIIALVIGGMIQVIIPQEMIEQFLGTSSGIKGIVTGSLAGSVMPGPPYASLPIVASLLKSGAGTGPMVAMVTAWALWRVNLIPLEIAFIGPKFMAIRFLSTLLFPILAGLIAQFIVMRLITHL